jgi:hypothetical protein
MHKAHDPALLRVVIVDVSHASPRGIDLARRLRDMPRAPPVIVTSCDCPLLDARLSSFTFIPKADLDARALTNALALKRD